MADVFPRRNLPGEAEQWGRDVEGRIQSADAALESIQQSLQGQNRNTASSLSVLAEQIRAIREAQDEIIAQALYSNEESSSVSLPAGTVVPYVTPDYAPVYFTLRETRKATVRNSIYLATSLSNLGVSTTDAQALFRTYYRVTNNTTGQTWSIGKTTQYGAQASSGVVTGVRMAGYQTFFDDIVLTPGDYEFVTSVRVEILDGDSGSVLIQYPSNSIQIREKV